MDYPIYTIISVTISGIVAFVISYIVTIRTISFELGKVAGKTDSIEKRIDWFENRFDKFTAALISKTKEEIPPELEKYISKLDDFLKEQSKKENPLSVSELEKMKRYRDILSRGEPLSPEEYNEFKYLAGKMREDIQEKKRDAFDAVIAGLLGFAAGVIIGALL